ncbi:MAG TPA: hypothetical protein VJH91_03320 [Candidatus Paceibacterota bacterium]
MVSDYWHVVLRAGVAFAFLYPPIHAIWHPDIWIGYFPPFLFGYVPDEVLLHGFGIVEIIIALWILSGHKIFWPSLIAAAMLTGIVVFHWGSFEVLFRDASIAAAALALALFEWRNKSATVETS